MANELEESDEFWLKEMHVLWPIALTLASEAKKIMKFREAIRRVMVVDRYEACPGSIGLLRGPTDILLFTALIRSASIGGYANDPMTSGPRSNLGPPAKLMIVGFVSR